MAIVVSSISPSTVYKRDWGRRITITGTGFAAAGFVVTFSDAEIEVLRSVYLSGTKGYVDVNIPDTCTEAAGDIIVTTTAGGSGTGVGLLTIAAQVVPLYMPKPENAEGAYLPFVDNEGKAKQVKLDSSGRLPTITDLQVKDIEIGAVEIKNATDDTRAVVKSDGVNNALVVTANGVSSLTTAQIAVGDVATLIKAATVGRKTILITNPATATLYVGAAGVTTITGFAVPPKCTVGLGGCTAAVYGVYAAVGPTTVTYLEV